MFRSFDPYDALSRNLTQVSPQGTVTSTWDAAGRRTQLTYPGTGLYLNYDYLLTGEVTKVRENGATSGIGVLASYGYDDLGNRTSAAYGNGTAQAFGYDPVSRLSSLTVDLAGTASDLTKTSAYNPASQIVTETRSNDAYAQVLSNQTQTTVTNGLNQLSTVNGTAAAYDARGNMTTDPATAKTYSYYGSNNQLWNVPSPFTTLGYDALDRLWSLSTGTPVTVYVSDGTNPIAEYDGSNVLQKRYAFDGSGQPLVQYDASGNRTWMVGDERGSVIALASDSGAMTSIDTYDEYGIPGATNAGTFQYAGMLWLSRPGLYAPTYRAYGAHLGRFSQTDPIGIAGGVNLYAYVGGNPVNRIDPLGLQDEGLNTPPCVEKNGEGCPQVVTVTGIRLVDHSTPTPDPNAQLYPVQVLAAQTVVVTGKRLPKSKSVTVKLPPPSVVIVLPSPKPHDPINQQSTKHGLCAVLPSSVTYGRVATAEGAAALRAPPPFDFILGLSSVKDGVMSEIVYDLCE